MRRVLAMVAEGARAPVVLDTAAAIAELIAGAVEAINVHSGVPDPALVELTRARGVELQLARGDVDTTLIEAAAAPDVLVVVLGTRSTMDQTATPGQTALAVLQGTEKPVVVVSNSVRSGPRPIRTLLLPIEDGDLATGRVAERLAELIGSEVEVDLAHVFTEESVPTMLDRPVRDLEMLADNLRARRLPSARRAVLRRGAVGDHLVDHCTPESTDLAVLSWRRDASTGRARVVKALLRDSSVPLLLLPIGEERE